MTNRDAGRHETWLFSAFQAQPVPSASPVFKVNKLAKTPVSSSERKREREVETERGMRETCRLSDTELLPSDVPDGPI